MKKRVFSILLAEHQLSCGCFFFHHVPEQKNQFAIFFMKFSREKNEKSQSFLVLFSMLNACKLRQNKFFPLNFLSLRQLTLSAWDVYWYIYFAYEAWTNLWPVHEEFHFAVPATGAWSTQAWLACGKRTVKGNTKKTSRFYLFMNPITSSSCVSLQKTDKNCLFPHGKTFQTFFFIVLIGISFISSLGYLSMFYFVIFIWFVLGTIRDMRNSIRFIMVLWVGVIKSVNVKSMCKGKVWRAFGEKCLRNTIQFHYQSTSQSKCCFGCWW